MISLSIVLVFTCLIQIPMQGTKCDVREGDDVKNLVAFVKQKLKYIDIWVFNLDPQFAWDDKANALYVLYISSPILFLIWLLTFCFYPFISQFVQELLSVLNP